MTIWGCGTNKQEDVLRHWGDVLQGRMQVLGDGEKVLGDWGKGRGDGGEEPTAYVTNVARKRWQNARPSNPTRVERPSTSSRGCLGNERVGPGSRWTASDNVCPKRGSYLILTRRTQAYIKNTAYMAPLVLATVPQPRCSE